MSYECFLKDTKLRQTTFAIAGTVQSNWQTAPSTEVSDRKIDQSLNQCQVKSINLSESKKTIAKKQQLFVSVTRTASSSVTKKKHKL